MNKKELISNVAYKTEVTQKNVEAIINETLEIIKETVQNEEKIQLIGFGNFEPKINKARTGVNPATKEKIEIKESKSVRFKAGKGFKDYLNQ